MLSRGDDCFEGWSCRWQISIRFTILSIETTRRTRHALDTLYNYADQPVSFFYVHFIGLLSVLYLPLFAISSALDAGTGDESYWVNDVVAGLIVFLQVVFVIGLRVLGQKMSDPYGSDLEDLSVMHYVHYTWQMSRRMLESELPDPVDASIEEQLCKEGQSLGPAWEEERGFSSMPDESTPTFETKTDTIMVDEEEEKREDDADLPYQGSGCHVQ